MTQFAPPPLSGPFVPIPLPPLGWPPERPVWLEPGTEGGGAGRELNQPSHLEFAPEIVWLNPACSPSSAPPHPSPQLTDREGRQFMACEEYLPGVYAKYNNNGGWLSEDARNTPRPGAQGPVGTEWDGGGRHSFHSCILGLSVCGNRSCDCRRINSVSTVPVTGDRWSLHSLTIRIVCHIFRTYPTNESVSKPDVGTEWDGGGGQMLVKWVGG